MSADPIFIHSLWRAGSTYLWNRFRVVPGTYAYYEPFQETLGVATREELAVLSPDNWDSRHPRLDRGYYAEYLPLVEGHGIPTFRKSFSIDHYFEEDAAVLETERPYLSTLIGLAGQHGRIPVLGCCRTLGRAPWLKRAFGGVHILLLRNPRQQWYSGHLRRIESGHLYFETMPFHVLGKATWEPAQSLARLFGIPTFEADSFFYEYDRYLSLFGTAPLERSYAAFYGVLSLSLARALPTVDLIVDIDRLSKSHRYRLDIVRRIHALTGLSLDFTDAAVAQHDLTAQLPAFAAIERGVEALLAGAVRVRRFAGSVAT